MLHTKYVNFWFYIVVPVHTAKFSDDKNVYCVKSVTFTILEVYNVTG